MPEELEKALAEFVNFYSNCRCHKSLNNLTSADVYYGRGELILTERERIKSETLKQGRIEYDKNKYQNKDTFIENNLLLNNGKHLLRKSLI